MGCRVKGKTYGGRCLERDWHWSETKTNPNTERKWAFGFLPICTSHTAHCTQYMALIKMRHVINCCGSKQCSEVAIVIIAVTFSLDDSLSRETCMYWGCQMHGPIKRRKPAKISPDRWGFFPPFFRWNLARVFADLQEWSSALASVKLELLLTLFMPSLSFFDSVPQFSFTNITFTPA